VKARLLSRSHLPLFGHRVAHRIESVNQGRAAGQTVETSPDFSFSACQRFHFPPPLLSCPHSEYEQYQKSANTSPPSPHTSTIPAAPVRSGAAPGHRHQNRRHTIRRPTRRSLGRLPPPHSTRPEPDPGPPLPRAPGPRPPRPLPGPDAPHLRHHPSTEAPKAQVFDRYYDVFTAAQRLELKDAEIYYLFYKTRRSEYDLRFPLPRPAAKPARARKSGARRRRSTAPKFLPTTARPSALPPFPPVKAFFAVCCPDCPGFLTLLIRAPSRSGKP
jgi:hypothetical protein